MPDPFRPATPSQSGAYPPPSDPLRQHTISPQAPMSAYYPNPAMSTSPPPAHGSAYPPVSPPPRQSFAQVGQVMHDANSMQPQHYPPSFHTHDPQPPPPPQHPLLHHSQSQPIYDPGYGGQMDNGNGNGGVPQYDHWANGPPITTQQPAGPEMYMPDTRMMSPPPMIPHNSDNFLYVDGQAQPYYEPPTRGYSPYPGAGPQGAGSGMPGSYTPMGDNDMADQPLLSRIQSSGEARYGNPFSASTGDLGAGVDDGSGAGSGMARRPSAVNPDEPLTTLRYGAAPEGRMVRRLKTTKRVP